VYSVVPSPPGQREKKVMADLEYEVSLLTHVAYNIYLCTVVQYSTKHKTFNTLTEGTAKNTPHKKAFDSILSIVIQMLITLLREKENPIFSNNSITPPPPSHPALNAKLI